VKVNLRTRWVEAFDHSGDGQLLYFKERFVARSIRAVGDERFGVKLRRLGLDPELLEWVRLKLIFLAPGEQG